MAAPKLTVKQVEVMASGMADHIAGEKIAYSKRTIKNLASSGRFPADDDYESYLGKRVAASTRNASGVLEAKLPERVSLERISGAQRYKDPKKFFGVMQARPLNYARPWIFRPTHVGDYTDLVNAANMIDQRVMQFYRQQGSINAIARKATRPLLLVVRQPDGTVLPAVRNVPDSTQIEPGTELFLVNTSTWAAYAEALSVERYKMNGIMYHAAQVAAMRYRRVDITYTYSNDKYGPQLNLPYSSKYMRPVIRLALRGTPTGRIKFSKPGRNMRRRKRKSRARK